MVEPIIIYEDEHLMVIDKPSGMVVNDSQTVKELTVQKWFAGKLQSDKVTELQSSEFWDKGGVVHRLDKDTSGLMVLAKTQAAYDGLKKQFLERGVHKTYMALVHGHMKEKQGIISKPIDRHPVVKTKFAVSDNLSRMAVTNWIVEKEGTEHSLVKLEPLTGRTHQLRVHMQHLGHPIVGDKIYGYHKRRESTRLFLHATRLEFVHPITHQLLTFNQELPEELSRVRI